MIFQPAINWAWFVSAQGIGTVAATLLAIFLFGIAFVSPKKYNKWASSKQGKTSQPKPAAQETQQDNNNN